MAGRIDFKLEGAKEMERLLRELGPRVAGRVGQRAVRAGAAPIVAEAKRLVPVRTGALRDAITSAPGRRRGQDERVMLIGIAPPTSRRAHLTEFGTIHSAAHPFLRPALDSQVAAALEAMGRELASGLTREAEKLAK